MGNAACDPDRRDRSFRRLGDSPWRRGSWLLFLNKFNVGTPGAVAITILVGAGLGGFWCSLAAKVKMAPFIVTLAVMTMWVGCRVDGVKRNAD